MLTKKKVEKGSDQNTTVLYEHVSSNDKNTTKELYINQDIIHCDGALLKS